ncbi:putative DNA damage-binding protein 1-like isoform X1 [Capsicum annuum]|nr:putative DNA damage-binding protein 1-like isoform X1 [Capsicum annuum]
MPTPGCVASSSQQTKSVGPELHVVPLSTTVVDTDGDESEEDEQPTMQPKRISEAKTRLEAKKVPYRPTSTRKIGFKGYENGASTPKNLSYSSKKLSYKGNAAMTSNQLNVEKEKGIGKLKTMRGNQRRFCEICVSDLIWIRLALKLLDLELRLRKSSTLAKFFISNWRRLTPYFLNLLAGVWSPEEGAPFGVEFSPFDGELRWRRHRWKSQTVALRSNANSRRLRQYFLEIFVRLGSRRLNARFGTGPPLLRSPEYRLDLFSMIFAQTLKLD